MDSGEKIKYIGTKGWIAMSQAGIEIPFPTWEPRLNMSWKLLPGIFLKKNSAKTLEKALTESIWSVKSKDTTINLISKITTEPFSHQLSSANECLKYVTLSVKIYSTFACTTEHHFHKFLLFTSVLWCNL